MSETASCSSSGGSVATGDSKTDRLKRLRDLQMRRNEARKLNHKEVVEEDRRKKLPANFESKRKRLEWEEQEEKKRKECQAGGDDYERVKLLEIGADEAEKWERKKKKKDSDKGFSDFEQATARKYQTLTKQMKPNFDEYSREKNKMGEEAFYPTKDTLGVMHHKDSTDNIDRMVTDLEKQISKREKYSRRRAFDDEADIDYINERNQRFNQKLERFYGKYTTEIKQNLERGTAV
ncbi:pre-mRNA-splicing factor syf2-like [Tubulanus polymorphus]|uniref:pre-mRNA-splicing factor syf2-like n=1 Tax=Tubulanus polymorphus TaxID=672921 RepID=UPI003DA239D4